MNIFCDKIPDSGKPKKKDISENISVNVVVIG
jgi:hypothetical protein